MKRACLLFALGAFLTSTAFAQSAGSTNASAATPPPPAHVAAPPAPRPPPPPPITKDEMAEVNKAYADAIQANPGLVTEQMDLKEKIKALQDQQKDLQLKVNAALIQADPSLAPIIATHPNIHPNPPPPPKKESPPKAPKPTDSSKPPAAPAAAPATNPAPAAPTAPKPAND